MGEIGQRERWTVQKYGGTSVGKLLDTITGTIIPKYLLTGRVAVICSARSSLSKSKGTTSLLLEAIDCATSSETSTKDLDSIIDAIKDDHLDAVRNAVGDKIARLQGVIEDIENDCEKLRSFLKATWTVGEISDRTQDRVLAVGEKLSCRIVSASLNSKGIPAEVVLLDDVVQSAHKRHTRDQRAVFSRNPVSFLRDLSGDIEARILRCGNKVPVITGIMTLTPC
jgi:aspartate kinase